MTEQQVVFEIEREALTPQARALTQGQLCTAAAVFAAALEEAERQASGWKLLVKIGLRLAARSLRLYRSTHCGAS